MADESKIKILTLLQGSGWVLDTIKPFFLDALRKALCERFRLLENNIKRIKPFGLTALYYGLLDDSEVEEGIDCFNSSIGQSRLIPFQDTPLLRKFTQLVAKGATLFTPSDKQLQKFQEAEQLMREKSPICWDAYNSHIDRLYYFNNLEVHSSSHPHFFGVIFIGEDRFSCSLEKIIITLVHELAHQELFLLNTIDRLVLNDAENHLVHAPFQGKARPPIGRLHACHALYRMLQCEIELGIQDNEHERLFKETISTFTQDELTSYGEQLVNMIYQPYSRRF